MSDTSSRRPPLAMAVSRVQPLPNGACLFVIFALSALLWAVMISLITAAWAHI